MGKCDGLSDPDDHIQSFTTAGRVGAWTLPAWCHLFAQTLTGAARAWFDSLPVGRIDDFQELEDAFLQHFSQQRSHTKDPADILQVRRRDNESLEDFITRFNKEALLIGGVGEDLMRAGFRQGVRCDELIRCLFGRDGMPKTWDKLMSAAKVYAQTENSLTSSREPARYDNRGGGGHGNKKGKSV